MIKSFFLLLLLLLNSIFVVAQSKEREVVDQTIEWFAVTSSIKVDKHVNLLAEGQFRFVNHFEPMQFQARTAVEVVLNKSFSIVPLGYVYTWNPIYGEQPATYSNNEHRIWEQVTYKHKVSRFNISHRIRLEQRYIQVHSNSNGEIINHGYDMHTNRLRYRFLSNIPLNRDKMEAKTIYACVYDEIFMSWGKPVTYHEPDQNRIFAGLGYQINSKVSFQTGFFRQMLIKSNGAKQENNTGFQAQLTYNVDLTKESN